MRATVVAILLSFVVAAAPLAGETSPGAQGDSAVAMVYLGNEGFLVRGGGKKVLVDALQGPGLPNYLTLEPSIREEIETARPPYDGVDLILATHRHDDHFNPRSVGRYLAAEPGALFVSTKQSVGRLRDEFAGFEAIAERARGVDPEEGVPMTIEHAGIRVTILDLHHGRGRDVANLGFVFEVGGRRFLHVGDTQATPEEFAAYGLADMDIDAALLPFWLVTGSAWRGYERAIGAGSVFAIHVPAPDAPGRYFGGGLDGFDDFLADFRRNRPEVRAVHEPLEEIRIRD